MLENIVQKDSLFMVLTLGKASFCKHKISDFKMSRSTSPLAFLTKD